ncbi:glycosyltransferase [Aureivirga sp. CE67]|uniref:glycosyltransferase n=1 Tax=Aureivirga sp. CE67 TaxID=1788983 RepID=UPI0018CB03D3|nr:glycosyltransferase [Aureivirga sp. CE67]
MRIGVNPEKSKLSEIKYKQHRIIIPVYIPESDEEYFQNLFEVLKVCIESILKTVDLNNTVITIINNNCKVEVTDYIETLLINKYIDKHVKYTENYGKVYTVLAEARASYEDLITITDADVFFFTGWENEIIKAFNTFSKAGVISPLPVPNLAFYNNTSLFFDKLFSIKKGKIVSNKSFELFEEGVGNKEVFKKWKNKQFYLKSGDYPICIGACHFVATYRRSVLQNIEYLKPKYVFKNGYENKVLDKPIDVLGYYRLSLNKSFAYHLGNNIPKWIENEVGVSSESIDFIEKNKKIIRFSFMFKKIIAKGIRLIFRSK